MCWSALSRASNVHSAPRVTARGALLQAPSRWAAATRKPRVFRQANSVSIVLFIRNGIKIIAPSPCPVISETHSRYLIHSLNPFEQVRYPSSEVVCTHYMQNTNHFALFSSPIRFEVSLTIRAAALSPTHFPLQDSSTSFP